MKKITKVRELKKGVKVIREIKSEGDKEIGELTQGEISVGSEEGFRRFVPREVSGPAPVASAAPARTVARPQTEAQPNRPLYDVGRAMGDDSKRSSYRAATILSEPSGGFVDRRIPGRQGVIAGGQANQPGTDLLDDRKKYESDKMDSSGGKKAKRYAWEV